MRQQKHTPHITKPIVLIILWVTVSAWTCLAEDGSEQAPKRVEAPCGVIEELSGDVQMLDASRTQLLPTLIRTPVICGTWFSVKKGWVRVRHRNGPYFHIGSMSLVQVADMNQNSGADHLVLFKGQIFAQAGNGEEEFRMVSPSGRARVSRGKVIFLYSEEQDDTQLVAIEKSALLENRFETSRRVEVRAGESSTLNFKLVRVIPSIPSAISVAALKPRLTDLRLSQSDQLMAIRAASQRASRSFATHLVDEEVNPSASHGRKPASVPASVRDADRVKSYLRHQPVAEDAALRQHWTKKMTGGMSKAENLLYPTTADDPENSLNHSLAPKYRHEKKKLLDALTHLKEED